MERGIYTNPALSSIVPCVAVVHDNMDNSFRDPTGVPLAPLMVLQRGEPFDDWAKRTQPSIKAVAKVCISRSPPLPCLPAPNSREVLSKKKTGIPWRLYANDAWNLLRRTPVSYKLCTLT